MTRAGPREETPGSAEWRTSQGLAQTQEEGDLGHRCSPRGLLHVGMSSHWDWEWVSAGWGGRRWSGRKPASPNESPTSAGVPRGQPTSRAGAGAGTNGAALPDRSCSQVGRRRTPEARAAHPRAAAGIDPPGFHRERRRGRGGLPEETLVLSAEVGTVRGHRLAQRAGRSRWEPQGRVLGSREEPWRPRATPTFCLLRFLLGRRSQRSSQARDPETARAPHPGRCRWGRGRDRLSPGSYAGAHTCPGTPAPQVASGTLPPLGTAPSEVPSAGGRWRGPVGRLLRAGGCRWRRGSLPASAWKGAGPQCAETLGASPGQALTLRRP